MGKKKSDKNTEAAKTVKKPKVGQLEKEILKQILVLALGGVAVVGLAAILAVFPRLPITLNALLKIMNQNQTRQRKVYPSDLRRAFERMRKERLIDLVEDENGEMKLILQEKGIRSVIVNNLDQLKFAKPKTWDKRWRVIVFDIPEKYKKARDALVLKLKALNFYPLQKSVFVYPYPPHELINFLSEVLNVSPYIRIIEATSVEGEEEILAHFELKK